MNYINDKGGQKGYKMIFDVSAIESKLGYSFKDKMLLRKCFTHSSYTNEHGGEDNDLLEFFGDAIIQYVVTEYLFNNAYGDEGKLTEKRKNIVSRGPLSASIKKLGIIEYLLVGRGLENRVCDDEKFISNLYESVAAGIYLDGGMTAVKRFVKKTIIADFERERKRVGKEKAQDDSKSAFQEYVQKKKLGTITYQTLTWSGPAHLPEFRVVAMLNGARLAEGKGKSKKEAEKVAAKKALALLKKQEGNKK